MREYKSGTLWCVWRWKLIGYIDRLHVIQTPWFSICVHRMNHRDRELWLHDHPVSFFSLILRGGYSEIRQDRGAVALRRRRWFNFLRATPDVRHRIVDVDPGTVTLCFMGPRRRDWGFHTPKGWLSWREYYERYGDARRPL